MIKQEYYETRYDGVILTRTYSDENKYILQIETNRKYEDAIDTTPVRYTYKELDEYIPIQEDISNA